MTDSITLNTRIIAVAYLVATVSAITGFWIFDSMTQSPDYLNGLYLEKVRLSSGVLSQLINDAAVVCIGLLVYKIFSKQNSLMATTVLVTRIIEATVLVIGKIGVLLLVPISRATTEAIDHSLLGKLALQIHEWSFVLGMLPLGIGGFIFCLYLYRTQYIPRAIAFLGLIAYPLLFAKSIADLLYIDAGELFFVPGALFELVFPVWLLIKGFDFSKNTKR